MSNKYAGRPYHVAVFVSRNKDNKEVPDFKQRNRSFLTQKNTEELEDLFDDFVRHGVPGEFCRMYISVNERKHEAVKKALQHHLIDNPDAGLVNIEKLVASLAMKSGTKLTKRFLFDYDDDKEKINEFVDDICSELLGTLVPAGTSTSCGVQVTETPNGFAVTTERGFDTRELLKKWENVTVMRDGVRFVCGRTTGEEAK